jgi:methyl-accepting chemotaxis protein
MTDIILLAIAIILAVAVGFIIPVMLEFKRTSSQMGSFLKNTEESLNSSLKNLDEAMRSVKELADNVNDVTRNAKSFSSSLADTAHSVRSVGKQLEGSVSKVTALRVGLRTAFDVFVKHLITRKGGIK